ncbi:MAG: ABC transporter permease [Peptostreptococcaceae bacterium]|nr:ABC transporter permease [Peptostreptococcaceae bacterium]
MIFKIIINIILAINVFLYGMDNQHYFNKVSYPIIITLISVSLSLYIFYSIKYKEEKILLLNIIYILLVSYIYPPSFILAIYMIIEYIEVRNYNKLNTALVIFMYIFISIKVNLDYTNIFLGLVFYISTYEIINYQQKVFKLEKYNFDLKEKNFGLEEIRRIDNKINYQNLESIKIEERNVISQKLHDKIDHILAGIILIVFQSITLLGSFYLFNQNFDISLGWMVPLSFVLSFVGIAIALVVLTISSNSTMYYTLLTLIVTPMCLLSGGFVPTEFMPEMVQNFSLIFPLTWINAAYKKILMEGSYISIGLDLIGATSISLVLIMLYLALEHNRKNKLV